MSPGGGSVVQAENPQTPCNNVFLEGIPRWCAIKKDIEESCQHKKLNVSTGCQ
jgi:hypothetical protein